MVRREWVQVERNVDGLGTQYGFKLAGVVDPLETDLAWQATKLPVPALYEPYMMYASLAGTKTPAGKGRWGVCHTCREEFPLAEMTLVGSRYYCSRNKCDEDFQ